MLDFDHISVITLRGTSNHLGWYREWAWNGTDGKPAMVPLQPAFLPAKYPLMFGPLSARNMRFHDFEESDSLLGGDGGGYEVVDDG